MLAHLSEALQTVQELIRIIAAGAELGIAVGVQANSCGLARSIRMLSPAKFQAHFLLIATPRLLDSDLLPEYCVPS